VYIVGGTSPHGLHGHISLFSLIILIAYMLTELHHSVPTLCIFVYVPTHQPT